MAIALNVFVVVFGVHLSCSGWFEQKMHIYLIIVLLFLYKANGVYGKLHTSAVVMNPIHLATSLTLPLALIFIRKATHLQPSPTRHHKAD